ncbi:MAG: hypothetical protein GF331_02525 [Chitinivibrionales bacterium]|nr:hypothetical protein [Chitinivibrionales bacterium]
MTPAGDTLRAQHTFDAYLRPFGWASGTDSAAACDVRILRQHRIQGADTCFGPENVDVVWLMKPLGGGLSVNGMALPAYDGDLAGFFPQGALDALEAAYEMRVPADAEPAYELGKGKVVMKAPSAERERQVTIELPECPKQLSFATFVRDTVASLLAAQQNAQRDSAAVVSVIDSIYAVLLTDDLREQPGGYLPLAGKKVGLSIVVAPRGHVIEAEAVDPTPDAPALRETLLRHARAWRFPAATDSDNEAVTVVWTGRL